MAAPEKTIHYGGGIREEGEAGCFATKKSSSLQQPQQRLYGTYGAAAETCV